MDNKITHISQPVITIDIDWAPDFMIDYCMQILLVAQVKATWFITHKSPMLDKLRQYPDLFELGIHPNFYPNSSHGESEEAIIGYCMDLVPEARSMRTHGLCQSSYLLKKNIEVRM